MCEVSLAVMQYGFLTMFPFNLQASRDTEAVHKSTVKQKNKQNKQTKQKRKKIKKLIIKTPRFLSYVHNYRLAQLQA